jgi:hypothetical protein
MAPKVFLTGATGYIGGDLLFLISQTHPEWEITCIVRNKKSGNTVSASYPDVRIVYGDNDSAGLLEEEAVKADIVFHTSNSDDNEPSAKAIARGLARRGGYWIHTSGILEFALETIANNAYGERFDKVFNDWEGIGELTTQPDQAPHRNVDKIVLASGSETVKVAMAEDEDLSRHIRSQFGIRSYGTNKFSLLVRERTYRTMFTFKISQTFTSCLARRPWMVANLQLGTMKGTISRRTGLMWLVRC